MKRKNVLRRVRAYAHWVKSRYDSDCIVSLMLHDPAGYENEAFCVEWDQEKSNRSVAHVDIQGGERMPSYQQKCKIGGEGVAYAAVRLNGTQEYIDVESVWFSNLGVNDYIKREKIQHPKWDKRYPVQRIIQVKIEEI